MNENDMHNKKNKAEWHLDMALYKIRLGARFIYMVNSNDQFQGDEE